MSNSRIPVRLSRLTRAYATHQSMHPQPGDLPGGLVMDFSRADGPAPVHDGRDLRAVLTPSELAMVLDGIPALSLDAPGDLMALVRVTDMLTGRKSRFTGVRLEDLRAVIELVGQFPDGGLSDRDKTALARILEAAGLADGSEGTVPQNEEQGVGT